jgi:hypothetical protein
VTFYYWSYFLAMAFTRLQGEAVWFVDPVTAAALSTLAPPGSPKTGAGTFFVRCGRMVSATDREVQLNKSSTRVHDGLWKLFFEIVRAYLPQATASSSNQLEERLYLALHRTAVLLGPEWPSKLRNSVNYRPGFAYSAVRRQHVLDSFRFIDVSDAKTVESVVDRLESNVAALPRGATVDSAPNLCARLLADTTFLLNALARSLHAEVVERRSLDGRWRRNRETFISSAGLTLASGDWPC